MYRKFDILIRYKRSNLFLKNSFITRVWVTGSKGDKNYREEISLMGKVTFGARGDSFYEYLLKVSESYSLLVFYTVLSYHYYEHFIVTFLAMVTIR